MKMTRTLGSVLIGIGALTCAVVYAQAQEKAKQPSNNFLIQDGQQELIQSIDGLRVNFNYQQQTQDLAKQYVKTEKEDQKKEIRKKLGDVLAKQFDSQVEKQQKELADLEKQIANLKALLKKRTDAKTTIIDRRMDQLIQDAEGLGWNVPNDSNAHTLWQHAIPSSNSFPEVAPKRN